MAWKLHDFETTLGAMGGLGLRAPLDPLVGWVFPVDLVHWRHFSLTVFSLNKTFVVPPVTTDRQSDTKDRSGPPLHVTLQGKKNHSEWLVLLLAQVPHFKQTYVFVSSWKGWLHVCLSASVCLHFCQMTEELIKCRHSWFCVVFWDWHFLVVTPETMFRKNCQWCLQYPGNLLGPWCTGI